MSTTKWDSKFLVFLVAVFAFATSFSHAQILTGAIRGTVTDEQGLPLPGVTVELSSPVLMGGVHSQLTSENGAYRFPNLPPGTYKIVFKIAGFQTIERSAIHVTIKEIMTVDISMKPARLEETVTVIGESPIIDVTSSGASTTIDKDFIDKIPLGRNSYIDIATLAPGMSAPLDGYAGSTWLAGYGSNVESNAFQLDGLDSTSSAFGYALLTPNQDTFSEVEISGIGQPAEYGSFSGVVVNVVTKSGGNAFSGTLSYYGQFQALTDDNNPDPAKYFSYARHKFYDGALSFGGPLLKDKLWFFASANITKQDATDWTVDPQYHSPVTNNNYMFKLSYQVAQNHKLVGVFSYAYYDAPGIGNQWQTSNATRGFHRTIPPWNVMYTWMINKNAYFELKTSGYSFSETGLGADGKAGLVNPRVYDLLTGLASGGCVWPCWTDYSRLQVSASVSYFADNFLGGSHEFKMGVQYNRGKDVWAGGYSAGKYYVNYGGEKYLMYTMNPFHYGGVNLGLGAFVDDTWHLGKRLTLNWGLRFDSQTGSIPPMPIMTTTWQDTSVIDPGMKDLLSWRYFSPRIGLTYALTSDNKTVLKGHYGRYYDSMFSGTYECPGPLGTDWGAYYWDGGEWVVFDYVPGSLTWIAPRGLKDPVNDSFSIGLERELLPDFSIEVLGTYKNWRNEIAFENTTGQYELIPMVSPDNGKTYMVYNQINVGESTFELKNHKDHRHDYKGISLILKKRYSKNWLLNASLTLSRSYGKNAISSMNTSSQMNVTNMSVYYQGRDLNDWINAKGLMNADRTLVFKLQFGFNFPWDILLSMNYLAMSGRPYVEQVRVYPDQGMRIIFAEPRSNKLRFDPEQELDVRVAKTFTLYRNVRFSVMGDVFNLLNNKMITSFRSYRVWSELYRLPSSMLLPRRLQVGLRLEF